MKPLTTTPLIATNRHLLQELQAIRIGLEMLIESGLGKPVSLIAMALSQQENLIEHQDPLGEDAITYDRPQEYADAEAHEEEETDQEYICAVGGFKGWQPRSTRIG